MTGFPRRPCGLATVLAALAGACMLTASCDDPALGPGPDNGPGCDSPCPVVWSPAGNPHRLEGVVEAARLILEAGAVVEAGPAGQLKVEQLVVNGLPDRPVVFRPRQPSGHWRGIEICCFGDASVIRHASVDGGSVSIYNTILDMQSTTVRRAPGSGVSVGLRSLVSLTGGSIEDNEGIGVHVLPVPGNGGAVVFRSPVRITRNGSYGLVAPMWALYGVLSTQDGWDAIQGNGADTIIAPPILGWFSTDYASGPAVLREGAVVTTRPTCAPGQTPYSLVMEPGSRLALTETASCEFGSDVAIPLRINGTTEQPVRITGAGATLSPTWSDTVRITHAIISGLRLRVRFAPAVIEHAKFDSSEIQLSTAGSRLQHTQLIRATAAAVTVTNGDVELSDCLIRHSTGDGVHVVDGSARINRCDLENNAGVGVRNSGGAEVDATDNWWGDPQGPLGPGGDGVEGSVRFTPFRSVPVRPSANKTR